MNCCYFDNLKSGLINRDASFVNVYKIVSTDLNLDITEETVYSMPSFNFEVI